MLSVRKQKKLERQVARQNCFSFICIHALLEHLTPYRSKVGNEYQMSIILGNLRCFTWGEHVNYPFYVLFSCHKLNGI